jgi:hypothetical protein
VFSDPAINDLPVPDPPRETRNHTDSFGFGLPSFSDFAGNSVDAYESMNFDYDDPDNFGVYVYNPSPEVSMAMQDFFDIDCDECPEEKESEESTIQNYFHAEGNHDFTNVILSAGSDSEEEFEDLRGAGVLTKKHIEAFSSFTSAALQQVSNKRKWSKAGLEDILSALSEGSESIFGASLFPKSVHMLEKESDVFWKRNDTKRILCNTCGSSYSSDCASDSLCSYKRYVGNRLSRCDSALFGVNAKGKRVPLKVFTYFPLKNSLARILERPKVFRKCIYGIQRIACAGRDITDIYEGSMFQDNYKDECIKYLSNDLDYVPIYLMLNCDGFIPFKHRPKHSSWVFIITICNLPRALRNKEEFSIIWTVAQPPSGGFSGILDDLVTDLERVFEGFFVNGKKCKAKVVMTCCDLPASRKLLGFTAINSTVACQFCKHQWPRQNSQAIVPDFSDCSSFLNSGLKTHSELCESAAEYRACTTETARVEIAQISGFKDSPFLRLPYFDLIEVQTLDIMHLLGCGVIKKMVQMIVSPADFGLDPNLFLKKITSLFFKMFLTILINTYLKMCIRYLLNFWNI